MPSTTKKEDEASRLEDLDVREVSVVDKPANDSPFLVVKSVDGKLVFQLKQETKQMPKTRVDKTEGGDILDLLGLTDVLDGGDAGEGAGGEADPVVPLEIEKSSFRVAVERAINTIMQKLTKAAAEIKDGEPDEDAIGAVDWVAKALNALADKLGEGEAAEIAPGDSISATVLKATNSLMGAAALVKDLAEDADAAPEGVPGTLRAVAALLTKAVEVAKMQKPNGDGPVSDHAGQPTYEPLEVFVNKSADGNHVVILKRGAKMKKARLNQLRKAIETLSSILSELEGDDGRDKTQKAAGAEVVAQLEAGFEALEVRVGEKINEAVAPLGEALEGITKRVDEIDGETSGANGGGDPEETVVTKNQAKEPGLWDGFFS